MADFFETRMGRQYYESTVPALVKAMERIADALEAKHQRRDRVLQSEDNVLPEKNGKRGRRHDD